LANTLELYHYANYLNDDMNLYCIDYYECKLQLGANVARGRTYDPGR